MFNWHVRRTLGKRPKQTLEQTDQTCAHHSDVHSFIEGALAQARNSNFQ